MVKGCDYHTLSGLGDFSALAPTASYKQLALQSAVVAGLSLAAGQAFAPSPKHMLKYTYGFAALAALLIFIHNKPLPKLMGD